MAVSEPLIVAQQEDTELHEYSQSRADPRRAGGGGLDENIPGLDEGGCHWPWTATRGHLWQLPAGKTGTCHGRL
jgi:hypothetical protein